MQVTAVILTRNESLHLARCISSLQATANHIVVVDCYSTDDTVEIAKANNAIVLQHEWVNHAAQFNWALTQIDPRTDWVIRIDADEILTPSLNAEISSRLPRLDTAVSGIYWNRRMTFQGRTIKHGGVFPVRVLRMFRFGQGQSENRWMDEHIQVTGKTVNFSGEMIDDNLNSLTWWTNKHNRYASLEAVEMLNLEYRFMQRDITVGLATAQQPWVKRWIKEKIYVRLPGGFRAFVYFFYRYVARAGFLDGRAGMAFHFLQGFWYRYLVDAKVDEVKRYMRQHDVSIQKALLDVLEVRV